MEVQGLGALEDQLQHRAAQGQYPGLDFGTKPLETFVWDPEIA